MREFIADVLYRPSSAALRFLPEGPIWRGGSTLSWVGIQHGATAETGSLNVFDLTTRRNISLDLPGRPGFAFPTTNPDEYLIGCERHVGVVNRVTGEFRAVSPVVDSAVTGTIINDGTPVPGGIVFGCKDLKFAERKAGLYLWRYADRQLIQLRADQTCSNGKEVARWRGRDVLLDIDTPTKLVVAYELDVAAGTLSAPETVLDLRSLEAFPDGMVLSPDGQSAIISFYDPRDVPAGETRQYSLETGEWECVWRTPGSPRVTCPALVEWGGAVRLIVTTAVEHMTPEEEARHPQAGSLFIADTPFRSLPAPTLCPVI